MCWAFNIEWVLRVYISMLEEGMGEVEGPGFKCMSPDSRRVESGEIWMELRKIFVVNTCSREE